MGCCDSKLKKEKQYVQTLADSKDLKATYEINKKVLGAGSYGKVFKAHNKKDESLMCAIKVIDKSKIDAKELINLKGEVKMM